MRGHLAIASLLALTTWTTWSTTARADDPPDAARGVTDEEIMTVGSARSMANDWIIPPRGWTLGSALSYETSRAGIGDRGLSFTDVVFLRLDARAVVAGRAELYGGVDLLPKQPSFTDELIYQGAHGGALVRLPHRLGLDLRVDQGPLMEKSGWYAGARVGLVGRRIVHEILAYQGEVAGAWTPMRFDGGATAWLAELTATGTIVFRAPEGSAAAWVGFGFAFPLAHKGDLPGVGALDPRVRSDVRFGAVVSLIKEWDVYAEYAILDRGDYTAPRTMLPILDGGFDQQQLTFGIVRHFGQDVQVPAGMNIAATNDRRDPRAAR